jgi:hypothetical protein
MSLKSANTVEPRVPETVVLRPFLGIAQNGISFRSFLESLLRRFVPGIAVGMVLECKLSVRALDFLFGCAARNAEDVVEIAFFPAQLIVPLHVFTETLTIAGLKRRPLRT